MGKLLTSTKREVIPGIWGECALCESTLDLLSPTHSGILFRGVGTRHGRGPKATFFGAKNSSLMGLRQYSFLGDRPLSAPLGRLPLLARSENSQGRIAGASRVALRLPVLGSGLCSLGYEVGNNAGGPACIHPPPVRGSIYQECEAEGLSV